MLLFEFKISNETNVEAFFKMMRTKYPEIIGRKRFCCHPEENTKELQQDCLGFRVIIKPISNFKETTFTATEMAALKCLVDYAASCCGGGEDTIGAILSTGAHLLLKENKFLRVNENKFDKSDVLGEAVVDFAKKIDSYE